MASNLDLQEQEQLDELKAFWNQYGNLITWTVTLVLVAFAAWNGWNWWQREQGGKASAMFDELDRAVQAGDAAMAGRVFNDLKERYGRTAYAQQAGLLAGKLQADKGQADAAQASLTWVAEQGSDDEYKALAHLRLAALLLDKKAYDDALKQVDAVKSPEFAALADDRRGDILLASGKKEEAIKAFQTAWKAMSEKTDYRRIVEYKLTALGAAPDTAAAASGVAK
jgi:predicted negative regulator of RcsB-dependent stress response